MVARLRALLGTVRMFHSRRRFMRSVLTALVGAIVSGRWTRSSALPVDEALQATFGTTNFPRSHLIELQIAELAEDGTVVPVHVNCKLADVDSITLVADNNPVPVLARFHFQPPMRPSVGTRIKLGTTTDVRAIVATPKGLFETRKRVRVIQGGCDLPPAN